jgi:hypothetical protein
VIPMLSGNTLHSMHAPKRSFVPIFSPWQTLLVTKIITSHSRVVLTECLAAWRSCKEKPTVQEGASVRTVSVDIVDHFYNIYMVYIYVFSSKHFL